MCTFSNALSQIHPLETIAGKNHETIAFQIPCETPCKTPEDIKSEDIKSKKDLSEG